MATETAPPLTGERVRIYFDTGYNVPNPEHAFYNAINCLQPPVTNGHDFGGPGGSVRHSVVVNVLEPGFQPDRLSDFHVSDWEYTK